TALEEANRKLSAARLGESMERNQESERLQVIEQPVVPQNPIKPNRPKLFALAFALAIIVGLGTALGTEVLNKAIHSSQDLAGVVDSRLIVAIPYITTTAEMHRSRRSVILSLVAIAVIVLGGLALGAYLGLFMTISSWLDWSWMDQLRHLSFIK